MPKEVPQYILDKLDFNEEKLHECLKEIKEIRDEVVLIDISNMDIPNIERLLGNEKYRILTAMGMTNNKREASKLLNMVERTFYRKIKKYKISQKL